MRRHVFLLFLIVQSAIGLSQSVWIDINTLPAKHQAGSSLYMAGSFNNWNPADNKYKFQVDEKGHYILQCTLPDGSYAYKITRGSWDKVECTKNGQAIANRVFVVKGDTKIDINIEAWQDDFNKAPVTSTASKQVYIIDTAFTIPQLNRKRRIWIYLPENYASAKKDRYPVLYMHDGQNLFNAATSFAGEWGVDEFLDSVKLKSCIVVGIDNGGTYRMNEYNPYTTERFGKGEGDAYAKFIVKTLKPYIDKKYRTKKDKANTFIAGSSMGGLISFYAVLKYPKVFGGAGVFSPSFWIAPGIFKKAEEAGKKVKANIYFFAGKLEGEDMVTDVLKVYNVMARVSKAKMQVVIRDQGKHAEATWRAEFPLFYEWIMR